MLFLEFATSAPGVVLEAAAGAYAGGGGGVFGVQTPPLCTDGVLEPHPLYANPPPLFFFFFFFFFFLLVTPEIGLVDGRYPYPMALHDFRR